MALVDGFLELERSSGKLEWSAILQKMASDLGFSKILFGLLPKDSQDYENAFIVGNYPAAWREHYDRAGYARVDPTVSHCTQSVLPIFWEPSIQQTGGSDQPGEGSVAVVRHRQDQLGDIGYLQLLGSQCELPYGKYSAEVRCDLPPRSGHYGR